MERAITYRDIHADDDSPRAQSVSLVIGATLAALAVAGSAILAVWQPSTDLGDSAVVLVRDSGAVYVRVDDVLHPVLNLTSARLIAATGEAPQQVSATAVANAKQGPLLGIPGAPMAVGAPLPESESAWTVCDHTATTVFAGPFPVARPAADQAILVTGPSGTTYLLYTGRRARVDLNDPAVARVLGTERVRPARVSRALLEMVPEVPAIMPPQIPGAGTPGPAALAGFMIGDVVQVQQATGPEFLVVLAGGVQRVGRVAADLIGHRGPNTAVTALAPAVVNQLPRLGVLAVETFPESVGPVRGDGSGAICATWAAGSTEIVLGAPQVTVGLAQADGPGPLTDGVSLPPGHSAYVRAEGTPGATGWLVTGQGVRFRVADEEAARILGLPEPVAVPRAVLDALPSGPDLSRSAALTAYDALPVRSP
ncbi:type VII secretion protein EccB [soil metagenome]